MSHQSELWTKDCASTYICTIIRNKKSTKGVLRFINSRCGLCVVDVLAKAVAALILMCHAKDTYCNPRLVVQLIPQRLQELQAQSPHQTT